MLILNAPILSEKNVYSQYNFVKMIHRNNWLRLPG